MTRRNRLVKSETIYAIFDCTDRGLCVTAQQTLFLAGRESFVRMAALENLMLAQAMIGTSENEQKYRRNVFPMGAYFLLCQKART